MSETLLETESNTPESDLSVFQAKIQHACKTNDLVWLQQQHDAGRLVPVLKNSSADVLRAAFFEGRLDIVKWLVTEKSIQLDVTVFDNAYVRWAARAGQLHVVKWLVEESGQPIDLASRNNSICYQAMARQHFDLIEWVLLDSKQEIKYQLGSGDLATLLRAEREDVVLRLMKESTQPIDLKRLALALHFLEPAPIREHLLSQIQLARTLGLDLYRELTDETRAMFQSESQQPLSKKQHLRL